jgi:hypothetical protein
MPSPYQEFVAKARARRAALQAKNSASPAVQKTSGDLVFTRHSEYKMKQYGLSLQKVRGVIRRPQRREVGIVLKTVAVMQPVNPKTENGKTTWKQEVWVLYKEEAGKKKIISAWRYPGISPKRDPIPEDILQELLNSDILEG